MTNMRVWSTHLHVVLVAVSSLFIAPFYTVKLFFFLSGCLCVVLVLLVVLSLCLFTYCDFVFDPGLCKELGQEASDHFHHMLEVIGFPLQWTLGDVISIIAVYFRWLWICSACSFFSLWVQHSLYWSCMWQWDIFKDDYTRIKMEQGSWKIPIIHNKICLLSFLDSHNVFAVC